MKYVFDKNHIFRRGNLKKKETKKVDNDSSKCKPLSIKERMKAVEYARKVKGVNSEDEDISHVIGEVYGG